MKILYLMHVDWNWIKQRPHFIAEELSNYYEIIVLYLYSYNRKNLANTKKYDNILTIPFFRIPKSSSIKILKKIELIIQKNKICKIIKKYHIDCLYIPYPTFIDIIPKWFTGKVLYDCMDRYSAFKSTITEQNLLKQKEGNLVARANHIFVSSQDLSNFIEQNYKYENLKNKISIVRNAFNNEIIMNPEINLSKNEEIVICYFGTISKWFDFDLIIKSLDEFSFIKYKIIGPIEVNAPSHPRIQYVGTVNHDKLYESTKDVDVFIMPFILNDIIKSVDPVKLYEYINFNKNIICLKYEEVERFEPFVYFYNNFEDFKAIIKSIKENNTVKYTQTERVNFLQQNTWKERCNFIKSILDR